MTRNLLSLISVFATLIVTACTGSPEQPSPGEGHFDRDSTPLQSEIATQTLYVATQQCPIFDPAQDQWDTGNGIGTPPLLPEIHAGLMRFTDDMRNPVEHDLAESYVVTPDHKTHTFTLRPDLRFSDGSHITTQDFKTSWERALKIGRERGYAHQMLGDIVGAAVVRDRSTSDLAGVTIIDERTLDIEVAVPNAQFGMLLAHPVSFVVKADQSQLWDALWPDTFNDIVADFPEVRLTPDQMPVGAGPFKLTAYEAAPGTNRCVLSRNEHYHGIPPSLDYVVLTDDLYQITPMGYPDEVFRSAFESQATDLNPWVLQSLTDDELINIDSVPGVFATNTPVTVAVLGLNPNRPPLNDPEVRETLLRNSDIVAEAYEPGYPAPNRILPKLLQPMVGEVAPISQAEAPEIPTALQQERVKGTFHILDDSETERFLYGTLLSNLTERWWQQFGIDIRVTSPEADASHAKRQYDGQLWQLTLQYPHPRAVWGCSTRLSLTRMSLKPSPSFKRYSTLSILLIGPQRPKSTQRSSSTYWTNRSELRSIGMSNGCPSQSNPTSTASPAQHSPAPSSTASGWTTPPQSGRCHS